MFAASCPLPDYSRKGPVMLNIHHLELFYYVARHGGIMAAVRNIPYGIQQPAVSGQILQLEEYLGGPLFQRRPFSLTPAGEQLYEFIEPFFSGIEPVAEQIRGGAIQTIRVAATAIVLRDHLPELLPLIRKKYPSLKITLREGVQAQVASWLQDGEIDLAVTLLDGKPPAGIHSRKLLEVPLVLLVPKAMKFKKAEEILKRDRITETLISFPVNEALSKKFQDELNRRKITWPLGMEVNSLDLVDIYASNGFGIGLSLQIPGRKPPAKVRELPLKDFPTVSLCALWQSKLSAIGTSLVNIFEERAKQVSAG